MTKGLRHRWRFFFEQAGWWANPPGRAVCALHLARAELWAEQAGVAFAWEPDPEPWDGEPPAPQELWGCIASLGAETVSLWSIGDPSPAVQRVIQAELALQLQTGLFPSLRQHRGRQ